MHSVISFNHKLVITVDKYRVKAWGQGVQGFLLGSDTDSASGSSKSLESSPCNSPHPAGQHKDHFTGSPDLRGVEKQNESIEEGNCSSF